MRLNPRLFAFVNGSVWCAIALLLFANPAPISAAIQAVPANLGFEQGLTGWSISHNADYDSAVVPEPHSGSSALKIWSVSGKPPGFANIGQSIDAAPYRGKLVRFRGWVRAEVSADGAGQLWLRVDGPGGSVQFLDNMMDRPIRNTYWRAYDIVTDVGADATAIVFGAFLRGSGAMWVDDLSINDAASDLAALPGPSRAARRYLEKAIAIMEKNSIRREQVDWPAVRSRAFLLARGGTSTADTYPAIQYALRRLGDHHSFLLPPAAGKQWSEEGGSQPRPEIKLMDDVGYIAVPSYTGGDRGAIAAYATDVQARIAAVGPAARCGWIVDLRNNGGGNMWPMLSGLGPILGDGELLSLVGASTRAVVVYRDGRAVPASAAERQKDAKAMVDMPMHLPAVAVLTSPRTASSGEAVTIAFRGREHSRSFGAPTAGLSTGNDEYSLADGAILFLTTSVMTDRSGRAYGQAVPPDVEVKGDAETVAAATQWLRQESGCGGN